jgi:hypothetical protein
MPVEHKYTCLFEQQNPKVVHINRASKQWATGLGYVTVSVCIITNNWC